MLPIVEVRVAGGSGMFRSRPDYIAHSFAKERIMSAWKEYRSHKIVKAAQIVSIGPKTSEDTRTVLVVGESEPFQPNVAEMADKATVGDYAVIYEDGYKSVSPKAAFEGGYTAI